MDGTANVPQHSSQRRGDPPAVGAALRDRLAAQLDAALASGDVNDFKDVLKNEPVSCQERRAKDLQHQVGDLFKSSDRDEDGKLNFDELKIAFVEVKARLEIRTMDEDISKAVQSHIRRFDLKKKGGLNEEEFREFFRWMRMSTEEKFDEKLLLRAANEAGTEQAAIDAEALHRAAETGNVKLLAELDPRLRQLLEEDEDFRDILKGDAAPSDPRTKAALQLYRNSFRSLQASGRDLEKDAFQAVMRDDAVALQSILDRGLQPVGLRNAGGNTLLGLARERGKPACEQVLLAASVQE